MRRCSQPNGASVYAWTSSHPGRVVAAGTAPRRRFASSRRSAAAPAPKQRPRLVVPAMVQLHDAPADGRLQGGVVEVEIGELHLWAMWGK